MLTTAIPLYYGTTKTKAMYGFNLQKGGKMQKEELKIFTIRLPIEIWKALKTLIKDGKIKSTNKTIVDLLKKFLENKKK